MSYTCTRARARIHRRIVSVRNERRRGTRTHTDTWRVTGKGGLVGETTGSATPRSWQLFPRWADRSAGRIQPSRAPSIMAPFSSFPYLRQHGWHGFLSLLGPILRHEHTPCRLSFSMDWVTSGLHSVERWRSEPRRHRRYTAGRRSKSDRQRRGDRHAKLLRRSVTRYTTTATGIAELCESAIRFLWYMTGSTRFSTVPEASRFSNRPVIARPHNYKPVFYVIHDIYRSYSLFL